MADRRVLSVNGEPVLNLRQMYTLVHALHASGVPHINFELMCAGGNAVIVMATDIAEEALEETLRLSRIPAAASPELVAGDAAAGAVTPTAHAAGATGTAEGATTSRMGKWARA